MDIDLQRLRYLDDVMPANVHTLFSTRSAIRQQIRESDVIIGAVLVTGAKAPKLITEDDLSLMRAGTVIVDVAVDQGGCVETIRPTTHHDPVYTVDGVMHYGVANMPGGVPRSSTLALTNATLPYALQLASKGWQRACAEDRALEQGVNVVSGHVTHSAVAEAFGLAYHGVRDVIGGRKQV
jgi:alanine dehydrogenase